MGVLAPTKSRGSPKETPIVFARDFGKPTADASNPVTSAAADNPVISAAASMARGKQFSFPPVISAAAPTFSVLAIVSSGSKSSLQREAIQLYRISHRELKKRLSTACSVYFVVKGGDSRIEIRDAG